MMLKTERRHIHFLSTDVPVVYYPALADTCKIPGGIQHVATVFSSSLWGFLPRQALRIAHWVVFTLGP